MHKSIKFIFTFFWALYIGATHALSLKDSELALSLGIATASQGKAQIVPVQGVPDDRYNLLDKHDQNIVLGLSYMLPIKNATQSSLRIGLNTFYFVKTAVKGNITQMLAFTNLGYQYQVSHIPFLLTAKKLINLPRSHLKTAVQFGVGPDLLIINNYKERSLDGGVTLPNNSFKSKTNIAFSAMAGVSLIFDNLIKKRPLELGYRFFYSQGGKLKINSTIVNAALKTGPSYLSALVLSTKV